MTFIQPPKGVELIPVARAAFGYTPNSDPGTWVFQDVSEYLRGTALLTGGRMDQAGTADPSSCNGIRFVNNDGRFTAGNPNSPYYPGVRRNVPLWMGVTWEGAADEYELLTTFINGWPMQPTNGIYDVEVPIQATGRLRKLRRSQKLVISTLTRAISTTAPIAWWPCEDGTQATRAASGLPGGSPMHTDGGTVAFGAVTGPPGTSNLPDTTGGGQLVGFIPVTTATSYRIEFTAKFPSISSGAISPAATVLPAGGPTNGIETWVFGANANGEGGAYIRWSGDGGTSTDFRSTNVDLDDGQQHHIRLDFSNNGGSMRVNITIDNAAVGGSFPWTPARDWSVPTRFIGAPHTFQAKLASIGEIAVWAPWSSSVDTFAAFGGYAGELATDRVDRLCAEASVPVIVQVGDVPAQAMGPQLVDTFSNLLDQCADVDNGLLHDAGPFGSLVYSSGSYRYNAPVALALTKDQLGSNFAGTYDDQNLVNTVTVTRVNGSSATYTDADSEDLDGDYGVPVTLNAATDEQLQFLAPARVHLGTWDGYRIPQIPLDARHLPEIVEDLLTSTVPYRVSPGVVPSPYPPGKMDQFAEGFSITLDTDTFRYALVCSPYDLWRVAVIDDPVNPWVLDAAASTLTAAVTETATALPITTASGPLLSTLGSDYPRDINLDGEQVTFTAVGTGISAVDGTFETGIAGWGAPSAATFAQDATQHHSGTKSGKLTATGGQPLAYVRADLLTGVSAGAQVSIVMWALSVPGVANFMVSIDWRDSGNSYLSTNSTTVTLAANTWTQVTLNATAPASAAFGGYGPTLGGTPSAGVAVFVDDITAAAVNYQIATVARSANSVVKAHGAGTAIKLYRPAVIAL